MFSYICQARIDIRYGYASLFINLIATFLLMTNIYRTSITDRDSIIVKSLLIIGYNIITLNQILIVKSALSSNAKAGIELDFVAAIISVLFIGTSVSIIANNISPKN